MSIALPPGACKRCRGVSSATDVCRKGELIFILSFPVTFTPADSLTGEERKNKGDEDKTGCRGARGVSCL